MQEMLFDNNKVQIFKNSTMFVFRKLFRNVGIIVLSVILYPIVFVFRDWVRVSAIVILIIFGGFYSALITFLNSVDVLESTIERDTYKSIYNQQKIYTKK